jgi:hypothetical protein
MNSFTKSRDSRIGLSSTPNNDLKSKSSNFRIRKVKKSLSPMGKYILGRKPSYMNQKDYLYFWSAKTSKRVQQQKIIGQKKDKRREFIDKRR